MKLTNEWLDTVVANSAHLAHQTSYFWANTQTENEELEEELEECRKLSSLLQSKLESVIKKVKEQESDIA